MQRRRTMRMTALLLATLACVVEVSQASRPEHWQDPNSSTVNNMSFWWPSSSARTLQQQQDALSNSNGCLPTIPKCEEGACATRNIKGLARWVCLRCSGNYEPVTDDSGQDNIVQCVCPRGTYEVAPTATSCTRCPNDAYCSGGDKVENPASRGALVQCGTGLVTRNTGARTAADCLAPAGFAATSPTAATPCGPSEYAPKFNRLKKCLKCQGGLEEAASANLTASDRSTRRAVCKVPPGRYISQGLVRTCPQGFYRENYTDFDAAVSQKCVACNPGITTENPGAVAASACRRVLAGHGVSSITTTVSGPQEIPALPEDSAGLPTASVCQLGYYSIGGYCVKCPADTATLSLGAKSVEECVVPPGYFIAGGSMTQCTSGSFREGWVMYSDPKATTCTACGDNIASEARDLDEHPLAANGSFVRASPTCCFIEAGQGMVASGKNLFAGRDCPINTYGVAGRLYGLAAAPCKPCPRNMITDNVTRATTSDACVNPHGFGYASEGASRCAPGFYAAKGSLKACARCPDGRTTQDNPDLQRFVTDCQVAAGYGIVGGSLPNGSYIMEADVTGLSEAQILDMSVIQCPTGYYSAGDSISATCSKCPEGSTTKLPGATSVWECDVCLPGKGKVNSTAPCTSCEYGFYQPGGLADCQPCPTSSFYPPVDGVGPTVVANGTTFSKGATSIEWCVPMQSQLSPEAGQAYFAPELGTLNLPNFFEYPADSMEACLGKCPYDMCCMAQYNAATGRCKSVWLPPAAETEEALIWVKLPPSTLSAASSINGSLSASSTSSSSSNPDRPGAPRVQAGSSRTVSLSKSAATATASAQSAGAQEAPSVRAKTIASGLYARCALPATQVETWEHIGSTLGPDARTFVLAPALWVNVTSLEACQEACDNSNVCWGGIYQAGRCMFRGGIDALNTRSFFGLPAPNSAPGLVVPGGGFYYFMFATTSGAPLTSLDGATQTLLASAVQTTLQELTPLSGDVYASVWEQSATAPDSLAVEIGLSLVDANGNPIDVDLSSMFVSNDSTTAYVAHTILELAVLAGDTSNDALLAAGLTIVSSDGAQQALGTPLIIDGCTLLPGYCNSTNAVPGGTCSLNVCQCADGWTGNRCTTGSA